MDEQQFLQFFPNASKSARALNRGTRPGADSAPGDPAGPGKEKGKRKEAHRHAGSGAELERDDGHGSLAKGKAKGRNSTRFLVRVTSIRHVLLDTDNLCEKVIVDCCRYAGLIPGDSPATTEIEITQRKAEKAESEYTIVEVFEIVEK